MSYLGSEGTTCLFPSSDVTLGDEMLRGDPAASTFIGHNDEEVWWP